MPKFPTLLVILLFALLAGVAQAQCELGMAGEGGSCESGGNEGGGGVQCTYTFPSYTFAGAVESLRYPDISEGGVSLVNGQFLHEVTDLEVYDVGGPLSFTRSYRSGVSYTGDLGPKWTHNWNESLVIGTAAPTCGHYVRWVMADGGTTDFFIPPTGNPVHAPESKYRIRREGQLYEIRHVSGEMRTFTTSGAVRKIALISRGGGAHVMNFEYLGPSGRLSKVWSNGVERLRLSYDGNGRLQRVANGLDLAEYVDFAYNTCGALEHVTRPAVSLGFARDGEPLLEASLPPRESYGYASAPSCAQATHYLTSVVTNQVDPLSETSGAQTVVSNVYVGDKVRGQCFGTKPCPTYATADLEYEYLTELTYVTDRRLPGVEIYEQHEYDENRLVRLIEDEEGLARETSYSYTSTGLLSQVTRPDGSCEITSYQPISEVWLPTMRTQRPAVRCGNPNLSGPSDRVTVMTYERFGGRLKSITPPEAFPDGQVPPGYDPTQDPHATLYDYDFEQSPDYSEECQTWGLQCPAPIGDVNSDVEEEGPSDPAEHLQRSGNVIRERRWVPADGTRPAGYLAVQRTHQDNGRVLRERQVFLSGGPVERGNGTEYEYYSNPAQWDYRQEHVASFFGSGPIAVLRALPSAGSERFETKLAWSARNLLLARQDHRGMLEETSYNSLGDPIERTTRCVPVSGSTCAAGGQVLGVSRFTHDLRGRLLREARRSPDGTLELAMWSTHDELGRLLSTTVDPEPSVLPGSGIDYAGRTPSQPQHLVTRTMYDGRGRPTMSVSPAGRMTCTEFDTLDRPTKVRQLTGFHSGETSCPAPLASDLVTTLVHDAADRLVRETTPEGLSTYQWFDAYGRPEFTGDGRPQIADVTDPVILVPPGQSVPAPPAAGWFTQVTRTSSTAGQTVRTRFSGRDGRAASAGFLQVRWDVLDGLGRAVSETIALSGTSPFVPASAANLLQPPTTDVSTSRRSYDELGRVASSFDPKNRETTYVYDDWGRLKKALFPAITTVAGTRRDESRLDYDGLGRRYRSESILHDPLGVAQSRVTEIGFDAWSRPFRTIAAPGTVDLANVVEYDGLGRVRREIAKWDAASLSGVGTNDRANEFEYDRVGRRSKTKQRDPASASAWISTEFGYDRDGLTLSLTDARGSKTDWEYDAFGRIRKMLYPVEGGMRQTVDYAEYDRDGKPKLVHQRKFDGTAAPTTSWTMTWDLRGRMLSRTGTIPQNDSPAWPFFGTTTQVFSYDDLSRMVLASDRSPTAGFTTAETNIDAAFWYDSAGRQYREELTQGLGSTSHTYTIDRSYDTDGFQTGLTYPGSGTRYSVIYSPDAAGRLSTVDAPLVPSNPSSARQVVVSYERLGGQLWSKRHPTEGTKLEVEYDGVGRIQRLRTLDLVQPTNNVLDQLYRFDRIGNLALIQNRHEPLAGNTYRTRGISTDRLGRLTRWTQGALADLQPTTAPRTETDPASLPTSVSDAEQWVLDLLGNWDSRSRGTGSSPPTDDYSGSSGATAANPLNQYVNVTPAGSGSAVQFAHDWLGQLRSDPSKSPAVKYTWDVFGRLSEVRRTSDNGLIARYRYDALNRRVEKLLGQTHPHADLQTWFAYSGWNAIEERGIVAGTPQLRARYGFGPGLDDVLWMDRDVDNPTNPPAEGGDRYYLHRDATGSTIAVTRATSGAPQVVERYTYSAYGIPEVWGNTTWNPASGYGGSPSSVSTVGLRYTFTGQRYDPETGLYYYKNRYFDPRHGRFLRRDLIGYGDGPSLYQYASSNPAQNGDALGLDDNDLWNKVIMAGVRDVGRPMRNGGRPQAQDRCGMVPVAFRNCGEMRDYYEQKANEPGDRWWTEEELAAAVELDIYEVVERFREVASSRGPGEVGAIFNEETGQWEIDGVPIDYVGVEIESYFEWVLKEGFKFVVFDYENPLGGSYVVEGFTVVGPGKFAKLGKGAWKLVKGGWRVLRGANNVCFVAGTLVETRSGLRPIEALRPGELVLSRDDRTGATAWRSVVQRFETPDQEVLEIKFEGANGSNETLRVTPEHPFWTSEGWTNASELLPGTLVLASSGGWIRVTSSTWAPERTVVYNIEVDEFHTYFVGSLGAWVHNSCIDNVRRVNNLPGNARLTTNVDDVYRRLSQHNGIDPILASERLHQIKSANGLGAADDVVLDRTGNVFDPSSGDWLGTLTEGGARVP